MTAELPEDERDEEAAVVEPEPATIADVTTPLATPDRRRKTTTADVPGDCGRAAGGRRGRTPARD